MSKELNVDVNNKANSIGEYISDGLRKTCHDYKDGKIDYRFVYAKIIELEKEWQATNSKVVDEDELVYVKVFCKNELPIRDEGKNTADYYVTDMGVMWIHDKGKAWYFPGMSVSQKEQPTYWMKPYKAALQSNRFSLEQGREIWEAGARVLENIRCIYHI